MRIERSKEWWLRFVSDEPDCPVSAGVPDRAPRKAGRFGMILLSIRAKLAHLWRLGIIKRTTAFRWEMDRALGEWS
jgi:hypothetical protein